MAEPTRSPVTATAPERRAEKQADNDRLQELEERVAALEEVTEVLVRRLINEPVSDTDGPDLHIVR